MNKTVRKLARVTLLSVLSKMNLKRPGVACSPQPSTTGESDATRTVQIWGVQAVCACAGPAGSRKSVIAAARVANLARGGVQGVS